MKKKLVNSFLIILITVIVTVLMLMDYSVPIKIIAITASINSIISVISLLLISFVIRKQNTIIPTFAAVCCLMTVGIIIFIVWYVPAHMMQINTPYLETSIFWLACSVLGIVYVAIVSIILAIIEKNKNN